MIGLLVPCSVLQQPPLTPRLIRGNTTSASTQPPLTRPSLFKHDHFEHFWDKHLVFTWRVHKMSIQVCRCLSVSKDRGTKVSRVRGPRSKGERKRKLQQQVGLEVWGQGVGMFRPIRMDHTNCLQVVIKTLQFNSKNAGQARSQVRGSQRLTWRLLCGKLHRSPHPRPKPYHWTFQGVCVTVGPSIPNVIHPDISDEISLLRYQM